MVLYNIPVDEQYEESKEYDSVDRIQVKNKHVAIPRELANRYKCFMRDKCRLLEKIVLAIGMPVLFTENINIPMGVTNGSTATVLALHDDYIDTKIVSNGEKKRMMRRSWTRLFGRFYKVIRKQFPLRPALALTCYKAEGKTFENLIVIDPTNFPTVRAIWYTSLSRV
ncbi:MAG: hypothetical protein Crog4KO_36600 [Crocinitomicaceae bacterium]